MKAQHTYTKNSNRKNERGNVLFYILIAIALLATLSYAVTQSTRGGSQGVTTERNTLLAGEIISYGDALANTVGQLRLRGCTKEQISFDNNFNSLYVNASAPANNSCHVFHPDGGGMTYQNVNDAALTSSGTGIYFDGSMEIENVGTTCASATCSDLVFFVRDVTAAMCVTLNEELGITNPSGNPPADNAFDFDPFTGSYTYDLSIGDTAGSANVAARKSGCVQETAGNTYAFYRVLIAR